jgi:hypothetical protein
MRSQLFFRAMRFDLHQFEVSNLEWRLQPDFVACTG